MHCVLFVIFSYFDRNLCFFLFTAVTVVVNVLILVFMI